MFKKINLVTKITPVMDYEGLAYIATASVTNTGEYRTFHILVDESGCKCDALVKRFNRFADADRWIKDLVDATLEDYVDFIDRLSHLKRVQKVSISGDGVVEYTDIE